jgi:predicted dehydrogenase
MSGWVFHAPFINLHQGFTLHGVWERTKQLAKEKYPDVVTYRSLEELLADDEVELVVVNTPNYTHYDFTKQALLANKHVIVEKPFTATVEEGNELIELARQQGKLITVYHNRRYDSDFKTVEKVVNERYLGDIVEAEIHYDRYKEELSPKLHKEVPGAANGSLYDLGSHLLDAAVRLFGMPVSVYADIRIVRPISQVDDYFELVLYYPALRVKVKSSYLVREPLAAFILHGSKGSFIKSRADVQEAALQAGTDPGSPDWGLESETEQGLLHVETNGTVIRDRLPSERGNYMEFYNAVYEALRNNQALPVSPEDALRVVEIIQKAYQSSRERRVVDV